jgi:Flp pilus assembly protein TadG
MSRSRHHCDGQSLVEFALILPIFVLVLIGIFDAGRAVYTYHTVNNAAREAGRHAMVDQTVGHIKAKAVESAVAANVDPDDVVVTFANAAGGPCISIGKECVAIVEVTSRFEAVTPLLGQLMGNIDLVGKSTFTIEINCVGAGCPHGS